VVKLIMTWNIRDGREAEFLEFVNNDFTRLFLAMNVQPTEAWYAIWGEGPQAMVCGIAKDEPAMERALASSEWEEVRTKVGAFAEGLQFKVVEKGDGFQL
jgi:hypothetical protein